MKRFMGLSVVAVMLMALGISTAAPALASPTPLWGPVFGSNQDGRLQVFAWGGTTSDVLYSNYQYGGGWHGWFSMDELPGVALGAPVVVSNKDGRMEVFAATVAGSVYHMWQVAINSGWSGWARLADWNMVTGLSATTNQDGRIEVLVSADLEMWSVFQLSPNPGTGWATINLGKPHPTVLLNGPVTAARNGDGRLEVFATNCFVVVLPENGGGCDAPGLYHKWQNSPGGGWSDWEPVGRCNETMMGPIATAVNQDKRLEFISIVATHNVYRGDYCHKWQLSTGGWSGYQNLGNGEIDTTAQIALASNYADDRHLDDRIEAFSLHTNGTIQHMWQTAPNGGWSGWATLGTFSGFYRAGLAAGRNKDGRLEVVALRGNGQPYHIWQLTQGGAWSDWTPLEAG